MKKESWINVLVLLLFVVALIVSIVWINGYMEIHKCDNPYKQVCVKSHTVIRMMPVIHSNGKTTTTTMHPMPHKVCDKYETMLKAGRYVVVVYLNKTLYLVYFTIS